MKFWAQIKPNNYRDLMLYQSQTCLRYILELGIWYNRVKKTKRKKLFIEIEKQTNRALIEAQREIRVNSERRKQRHLKNFSFFNYYYS